MKTLQESLFDKDLTTKEITLGSAYELNDKKPLERSGMNPIMMFDISKLEKYPNQADVHLFVPSSIKRLTAIVMDMPAPTKQDIDQDNNSQWCKELKERFSKFIKRSWISNWNKKVEVWLSEGKNGLCVDLNFDRGAGIYRWRFHLK